MARWKGLGLQSGGCPQMAQADQTGGDHDLAASNLMICTDNTASGCASIGPGAWLEKYEAEEVASP